MSGFPSAVRTDVPRRAQFWPNFGGNAMEPAFVLGRTYVVGPGPPVAVKVLTAIRTVGSPVLKGF